MKSSLPILWLAAAVLSADARPLRPTSVVVRVPTPVVSVHVDGDAAVSVTVETATSASSTETGESALDSVESAIESLVSGDDEDDASSKSATTINCEQNGHNSNSRDAAGDIGSAIQNGAVTAFVMFIMLAAMLLLVGLGGTCLLRHALSSRPTADHHRHNHRHQQNNNSNNGFNSSSSSNNRHPAFFDGSAATSPADRGDRGYEWEYDFDLDSCDPFHDAASASSLDQQQHGGPPSPSPVGLGLHYPTLPPSTPSRSETALSSPRPKGGAGSSYGFGLGGAGGDRPRIDMADVARLVALNMFARSRFVEGLPGRPAIGGSPQHSRQSSGTLIPDL